MRVTRLFVDRHLGHASPTPNPYHMTPYVASPNSRVTANGIPVVVVGGATACGDFAVGGSAFVTASGLPVHRLFDATSGHGTFPPNISAGGSPQVIAWK